MTAPKLASEPTDSTEASEPADPMDKIEPADPMDKIEPVDPMDKMDPLEPMLRIDPAEPACAELFPLPMAPFSQPGPLDGLRYAPIPSGHAIVLLVSTSDTDLLSARASGAGYRLTLLASGCSASGGIWPSGDGERGDDDDAAAAVDRDQPGRHPGAVRVILDWATARGGTPRLTSRIVT